MQNYLALAVALMSISAFPATKNLAKVKEVYFSLEPSDANVCALHESGELWCWGANSLGSLGLGNTNISPSPRKLEIPGKIIDFRTSDGSFALTDSGTLWSWGDSYLGRIGQPKDQIYDIATQVQIPDPISEIVTNKCFDWSGCINLVITKDRDLYQLGVDSGQTVPAVPQKLSLPGKVSHAYIHDSSFYVILQNGELWSWGYNGSGQLGLGHTNAVVAPTKVDLPAPVAEIQTSYNSETFTGTEQGGISVFATLLNGEIWSWGSNADGILGTGDDSDLPVPHKLAVALGSKLHFHQHAWHQSVYAVTPESHLYAWGANYYRSLGIGSSSRHVFHPTQVVLPSKVGQLVLNQRFCTYAVLENGEIWQWGLSSVYGGGPNVLDDPHVAFKDPSAKVASVKTPESLWLTSFFALLDDSRIFAWGNNQNGELGIAQNLQNVTAPELLPVDRVQNIWTSVDVTCVVNTSGLLRCLGDNTYGQLGQGHTNELDRSLGFGDIDPISF